MLHSFPTFPIRFVTAVICLVLSPMAGLAWADEPPDGLGERLERIMPRSRYERNHTLVRQAFREIARGAASSTVQVTSGDKNLSLGTVVGSTGWILTKSSEIEGRTPLECHFADGRKLPAEVRKVDEALDVAVLKVTAEDLVPVTWRPDDMPPAGSWVVTPEPSTRPRAIGIVSAAPRVIAGGMLGFVPLDAEQGARVGQVVPQSPADRAGLRSGDLIVAVNGVETGSRAVVQQTIGRYPPGQKITLAVVRGMERLELAAELIDRHGLGNNDRFDFQNALGTKPSRRRSAFPAAFEHDSVLLPEDCGGPLVDLDGQAIGINIARAGRTASYGLPVSVLRPLLDEVASGKLETVSAPAIDPAATQPVMHDSTPAEAGKPTDEDGLRR